MMVNFKIAGKEGTLFTNAEKLHPGCHRGAAPPPLILSPSTCPAHKAIRAEASPKTRPASTPLVAVGLFVVLAAAAAMLAVHGRAAPSLH